jgi:GH24 family phage-related lysozyme (muramidase)
VNTPILPPDPPAATKPGSKKAPAWMVGIGMVAAIIAYLAPDEGGQRHDVYLDSVSIPTTCTGIIGPVVTARWKAQGKEARFSKAECDALEQAYVSKMATTMVACLPAEVTGTIKRDEWLAYAHWAYNTGTAAFCSPTTTLHRQLAAGNHDGACRAMGAWTFVTYHGAKRNCRDPDMRRICSGIVTRRDGEVAMCLGAL